MTDQPLPIINPKFDRPLTRPICFHFRDSNAPREMGGITVVYNPELRTFGVSTCSKSDRFVKKLGFNRAFGRSKARNANAVLKEAGINPLEIPLIENMEAARLACSAIAKAFAIIPRRQLHLEVFQILKQTDV